MSWFQLVKQENPIIGLEEFAPDYRSEKKTEFTVEEFEDGIVLL